MIHSVEYDLIIKIQTLSWTFYDIEVVLDRANQTYFDIHVSLLYQIDGEKSPSDYSAIRVGYPAPIDARIGYLDQKESIYTFVEEQSNYTLEASNKYIGDITISPLGTELGIQQVLILHNITGAKELIIPDSPVQDPSNRVFDSKGWMDVVKPIILGSTYQWDNNYPHSSNYFVKSDFFQSVTDDLVWNSDERSLKGTVTIPYKSDILHIGKVDLQFIGPVSPSVYYVDGVGDWVSTVSPLKICLEYYVPTSVHYGMFQRDTAIRLYLLVKDRTNPTGTSNYQLISVDYGFSKHHWKWDHIYNQAWTSQNYSHIQQGMSTQEPVNAAKLTNYLFLDSVNIDQTFYWKDIQMCAGSISTKHFGTILGMTGVDQIYDKQHIWYNDVGLVYRFMMDNIPCVDSKNCVSANNVLDYLYASHINSYDSSVSGNPVLISAS